jgi:ABC-2 type transport system permease protein
MSGLIRSELRKISSTRLWWGLALGAVLFTALQAGLTAGFAGVEAGGGQPPSPALDTGEAIRSVYVTSAFAGTYIFALILGITGMTGEYRYKTITPTFLVTPRRPRVVLAKMVAHLGVGFGYAVLGLVVALVVGGIVISLRDFPLGYDTEDLWRGAALVTVAVALWTLLGIGIGTLIRNQVAAIMLAVFVTFLLEPLLTFALNALDLDRFVKWLPTNASAAITAPGDAFLDYLDWWAGGLVLIGYAVVLGGLGLLLTLRRDVT